MSPGNAVVDAWLVMTEQEVLASIARMNAVGRGGNAAAAAPDDEEQSKLGDALVREWMPRLRQTLCVEWKLHDRLNGGVLGSDVEIVIAVADFLTAEYGGMGALALSVLLFKRGLWTLCTEG